jgi:hypothetical protein
VLGPRRSVMKKMTTHSVQTAGKKQEINNVELRSTRFKQPQNRPQFQQPKTKHFLTSTTQQPNNNGVKSITPTPAHTTKRRIVPRPKMATPAVQIGKRTVPYTKLTRPTVKRNVTPARDPLDAHWREYADFVKAQREASEEKELTYNTQVRSGEMNNISSKERQKGQIGTYHQEEEEETEEETEEEVEEEETEEEEEEEVQEEEQEEEEQMEVEVVDGPPIAHSPEKSRKVEIVRKQTVLHQKPAQSIKKKIGQNTSSGTPDDGKGARSIMLTPYVPATFPMVLFHLGQGRYLSAGYVDGAYMIRVEDNYPKKNEDDRRRVIKMNDLQFLDLVSVFPSVTGELHRLQTAKQSSVNEDDKRHIGANIYVSIYRSGEENLFVDIRQFFIPEEEAAKGNMKLIPTRRGISLRASEWEQLVKYANHLKVYIPALRSTERCITTHQHAAAIDTCTHCSPNWML